MQHRRKNKFKRYLNRIFLSGLAAGCVVFVACYIYMQVGLPNVETLKDIHLQVPLRIMSSDGKLLAEFGEKRRIPVTLDDVPPDLVHAVLATEDQRFYDHPGVDPIGLTRAAVELIVSGKKTQGGSTITMQVARNFFLSRKKTYARKINEILLAIKIDRELTKDQILSLYLNKIYLGSRAYGVAAAAQVYYGKTLDQLTLGEIATIAGLPKAPSSLNPIANPTAARERRNHVLERMREHGYINAEQYHRAAQEPINAKYHGMPITLHAPYIAEMVRQYMIEEHGMGAYSDGFTVYTTIDSRLQNAANAAIRAGLINYDKRHGYTGPIGHLAQPTDDADPLDAWQTALKQYPTVNKMVPAAVLSNADKSMTVLLRDGEQIELNWPQLEWAKRRSAAGYAGTAPKQTSDIAKPGDVIMVEQVKENVWALAQIPEVEGAMLAIDPNNGAIKALVGGFDFERSKFNRITQAKRQPGSSFKPFIYSAALAKGFSLASVINDAPVVLNDPGKEDLWRPQNDTHTFYGPTRLRVGLTKSRNLVSIRLLESIGIPYTLNYLSHFGFDPEELPHTLSLALGSAAITPLKLASGYAILANGGYAVKPFLIDHTTDANNQIVYQAEPKPVCDDCEPSDEVAPRAISPQVAYLMTNAMQDVIKTGTGRRAQVLGRSDLSGKTGTTNDLHDAWFSGFNRDLVATVWMGFDTPRSLHEYAASTALPTWIDFMKTALAKQPEHAMSRPDGMVTMRINPNTGQAALASDKNTIFEIFRADNAPHAATNQQTESADNNDTPPPESTIF